jgi:hypothetical protein
VWVARDAYQRLVVDALAEPGRVCSVRLRADRVERVVECLGAMSTIDIGGVELRPSSIAADGERHVVISGEARFVEGW